MTSALVFAYHNVGVRCLKVLLAQGVEIKLVVTHEDDANENQWFGSVAQTAAEYGLPLVKPQNPNTAEFVAQLSALAPDFLFSFYYRHMLKTEVLAVAKRGAYNLHGSLLPKYRGRAPVNWAVLKGERETGATLHQMVEKPDAGAVIAREAVPILPNDTAREVFDKVTLAAEMALYRVLPQLIAGTAHHEPLDLTQGSYFGGRKPEDGRIDGSQSALSIHNLVRAVAPPYPGAFIDHLDGRIFILRTLLAPRRAPRFAKPSLYREHEEVWLDCADGQVLRVLAWTGAWDGQPLALSAPRP